MLVSVDHDDVVARIDMRRVFGLVLAAQAQCDFGCKAAEHLIAAIDHVPVALNFQRLGREGLHCSHLICMQRIAIRLARDGAHALRRLELRLTKRLRQVKKRGRRPQPISIA